MIHFATRNGIRYRVSGRWEKWPGAFGDEFWRCKQCGDITDRPERECVAGCSDVLLGAA